MSGIDDRQLAAAEAYEAFLVPALFEAWPPRILEAARVGPDDRVLDVACGTGVLARAAAARGGPAGAVVGIDVDRAMLAVATRLAPGVAWKEGSAEALPYADGSFDVVVSQFGLMFFGDPVRALGEMGRVLTQRGRVAIAVWDALERTPAYAAAVGLVQRVAGTRAADALRLPFSLGDPASLESLFTRAGLEPVVVERHTGQGRFPSIRSMVEADIVGWLPVVGVPLPEDEVQRILADAEDELARFVSAEGGVVFETPALIAAFERSAA